MKYVIIIPDGAADHPLEDLQGKTPFEAANKPYTDRLSAEGRQGTVVTTPKGFPCGSDVCSMSLLGYSPEKYHKGRAPLEAAAMGLDIKPTDWIFRVNLVSVDDDVMMDHSAGHISSDEGRILLSELAEQLNWPDVALIPGVSYRNIMIDRSDRDWTGLKTTPPHDIPGQSIHKYLPKGSGANLLGEMIDQSKALFADHEINQTRRDLGELPATHVWPWGQGQKPQIPSFESRFGLRGAMITAVDLLAGLADFIGWQRLDVPGQTSYHDTDYAAAGKAAIEAMDDYDVVCVHVEAPDEASHAADAMTKVAAIEAIDKHIVGPVHQALKMRTGESDKPTDGYRILYLPDHYTAVGTRKHDPTPVPFTMCGTHVHGMRQLPFTETNANDSDLHIEFGHELMEYFLSSGLS